MKIVIVSPHRDDAAFSLSLAVGVWLEQGHRVHVMNCFTRSGYAPLLQDEFLHANDRASYITALRAREDEAWRRSYRARQPELSDLALKDAPMRFRCSPDDVCTMPSPPDEKAATKIRKALQIAAGDAWVVPLALGEHVDHRLVRQVAMACAPQDFPVALYEDLPYATRPGVAASIPASARALLEDAQPFHVSAAAEDSQAELAAKKRQVLCYDSQVTEAEAGVIAEYAGQFGARERLWGNAAWLASPFAGVRAGETAL